MPNPIHFENPREILHPLRPCQTLPFCPFFHPIFLCRQRCGGGAGDHERDDSERHGGKRLLLSDHDDE